jgi:hypothetical protein
MFGFKDELVRNSTAYFLTIVGTGTVILGAFYHQDKVTETGAGLVSAAMLAFKPKQEQQQ